MRIPGEALRWLTRKLRTPGRGINPLLAQTQVFGYHSCRCSLALTIRPLHSNAQYDPLHDEWLVQARNAAEESPDEPVVASIKDIASSGHLKSHFYSQLSPWKSKEELAKHLQASILHNADGLLAINKPMGVGVRNTAAREEDRVSTLEKQGKDVTEKDTSMSLYHTRGLSSCEFTLEDLLPILKRDLGYPNLELVKSAEKFNSGVAIFSTNEKSRIKIEDSIRQAKQLNQFLSSYAIISVNIPLLLERDQGVSERVGIGLIENNVTGVRCPIIQRNISKKAVKNQVVKPINVELQVFSKNVKLNVCCTGIKVSGTKSNFLRVYYADLATPILGDHLYSARVKSVGGFMTALNPLSVRVGAEHQKFKRDISIALDFKRSEDSLIAPPHIHLQSISLPNFPSKKKHLELVAPLQGYFLWTCRKLGLKLPT